MDGNYLKIFNLLMVMYPRENRYRPRDSGTAEIVVRKALWVLTVRSVRSPGALAVPDMTAPYENNGRQMPSRFA
jgi:hypothetical protein